MYAYLCVHPVRPVVFGRTLQELVEDLKTVMTHGEVISVLPVSS